MRELEYPFDAEWILRKRKYIRKQLLDSQAEWIDIRVAVLGGFTTHDIIDILELFLLNYGIKPDFYESEYNQFYQDAMFTNERLEQFAPDICYICTSNRNINSYPDLHDSAEDIEGKLNSEYMRFAAMWESISKTYNCIIIQNNFDPPSYRLLGNLDVVDSHGRGNFLTRLNFKFYEYAQSHENFHIHDLSYDASSYGLDKWADPYFWHMYKYPMCLPAIPYLAFSLANQIKSIYGKNKKVLMLDLDNTLWGGVIGDDGAENIEIGQETSIGQAYSEFQSYVKAHKDLGVLLTVNSKNDMENALLGFRRPDSVLKEDDFISFKANWETKDRNLLETATELELLPESFVFVDDNPAERDLVRGHISGAAVPEIDSVENYIRILDRNGYFEVTALSADDLKRNEMYRANSERIKAAQSFENYKDYLQSLNMKAEIKPFQGVYFTRIAHLTNKSNQFNLTTRRYTLSEIRKIAVDKKYITLYGKLEDKFGGNGVVSVVIGKLSDDSELHIELWVMSCRVLKRDMEKAMMDELVQKCSDLNIGKIYGYYYPTAKNGMVKNFYGLQGFEKISDENGSTVWVYEIPEQYENKNKVIQVNN